MEYSLKKGDEIGIPCDVGKGAFPGEKLIRVPTLTGPISGFTPESELRESGGRWYVRAVVESSTPDVLTVWIHGSFFTTTGLAELSPKSEIEYAVS